MIEHTCKSFMHLSGWWYQLEAVSNIHHYFPQLHDNIAVKPEIYLSCQIYMYVSKYMNTLPSLQNPQK